MAYVKVPRDLTEVKSKVILNLTKRQLICFSAGGGLGIAEYFLLKNGLGSSLSALVMIASMIPFFLFAVYEKDGQPLEKVIGNYISVSFLRPKKRVLRRKKK